MFQSLNLQFLNQGSTVQICFGVGKAKIAIQNLIVEYGHFVLGHGNGVSLVT